MSRRSMLPVELGREFSWAEARNQGVPRSRLRARDLEQPFRGVRMRVPRVDEVDEDAFRGSPSPYEKKLERERALVRALGKRLGVGQILSHRSAALLWGAPVPSRDMPELHVTAIRPSTRPRIRGVAGHSIGADRCVLRQLDGVAVTDPATTWAMLADLPLARLVAIGDYFLRTYRPGRGRPQAGRPALACLAEFEAVVALGHWKRQAQLERAMPLLREDSWSPMESKVRVTLVAAGVPEPALNTDVFDEDGCFLGCVDMAWSKYRLIVEYQSRMHAESYAEDIERLERLRAAGWSIIQVTAALVMQPNLLVQRVERELRARGWTGI